MWEADLERYLECGGTEPRGMENIIIGMKILPSTTPATLLLPLRKATDYAVWKRDLKEQLLFLRQHGALGGAPGANFLGG